MKAKVYFSRTITPETVLELYKTLGVTLPGKVAVKVHSGEPGNQNFLRPDFWKPMVDHVNGTITECNTAYSGGRNTTDKHLKTMEYHGWSHYFPVEILDAEGPDKALTVRNGKILKENFVGKGIENYDSTLVLSHFKGHPMGGYGGAIKQLSIGFASTFGKNHIHSGGTDEPWSVDYRDPGHDEFLQCMADAASSVVDFFEGKAVYINVMKNMSVDCDCVATAKAPCMRDIGILISTDPVAVDQACIDLVYASSDPGREHLIKRIESRNGLLTIEAAVKLGIGSKEYELIEL